MRLEARKIEDGLGPYRWRPVVLSGTQLALGSQYCRPDKMAPQDRDEIDRRFAAVGYETREVVA